MIQSPAGYQGDVRIKRYLDFYQAGYGVAMLSSGVAFSPLSLFANGEQGGWYDPSDLTTLFQDAAGTTPVTAVEQPVGLVLDKSKGLVLGPELVTNGDFTSGSTGYVEVLNGTISYASQTMLATGTTGNTGVYQDVAVTANRAYQVSWRQVSGTSIRINIYNGANFLTPLFNNGTGDTITGTRTAIVQPTASTLRLYLHTAAGTTAEFDNISVRELPGSHLSQSTSTARPVLSARVNLLTYTEDFSNAAWAKNNISVAANSTTAPNGTATADLLRATAVNNTHYVTYDASMLAGAHTISVYAKAGGKKRFFFRESTVGGTEASFDLDAGTVVNGTGTITSVGSGWYLCAMPVTLSLANTITWRIQLLDDNQTSFSSATFLGDGTSGIYIWGADLRPSNAGVGLPAYQRVGAATSGTSSAAGNADYDTTGFPLFLRFDGTDDFLVSGTISPGSVDKAQVFAGVRKLSDAAAGFLLEYSVAVDSNNGAFYITAPADAGVSSYRFANKGTTMRFPTATGYSAPLSSVVAGIGDIAGDLATLRVNGVEAAQTTTDQGTGNYGSYPLYVGRRAGTTLPFNGQLYSLILRFSAANLDAATIAATETWVNGKTGAY